jgi:hypothetical protein
MQYRIFRVMPGTRFPSPEVHSVLRGPGHTGLPPRNRLTIQANMQMDSRMISGFAGNVGSL